MTEQPSDTGKSQRSEEFETFLKLRSALLARCLQIAEDQTSKASALSVAMNFFKEAGRYFPQQGTPKPVKAEELPFKDDASSDASEASVEDGSKGHELKEMLQKLPFPVPTKDVTPRTPRDQPKNTLRDASEYTWDKLSRPFIPD
jgi:hypothetical protein